MRNTLILILLFGIAACQDEKNISGFKLMSNKETGIDFENTIKNSEGFNIFNYRNFYNGGGVACGDINNDGLVDVLLTSNMGENKLFLNKGNFKFEDITQKAGIAQKGKWNTGVVMVDLNQDGWLDIYICNAGINKYENGEGNALFINNHDLTFNEKAKEYGLDERGYSTHAAFFDYDLDGDLDCYILNNSFIPVNTLNYDNNRDLRAKDWPVKEFLKGGGDKLLRNDEGHFVDVSEKAGIYGSLIGFGLGVTVGDVNNDNYPDLYISNDFFEKDYLYINQKNGSFKEELENHIQHTSLASMGADMADIDNDGFQEIFVTDMLPRDEYRLKTTTSFENHYLYDLKQSKGFYHQFMQNTLQYNNQDGTYSEIAYYADVAASDWSWGALLFDADNDRRADIYVCNGILHDVIDQDFIDFFANEVNQKMVLSGEKEKFNNIIKNMPSKPIINNFFHNEGNLKFAEKGKEFGFKDPSFSNGAAYADLDNDGDLDLIVNNVNEPCFVYKNNTHDKHYLKIQLDGESPNLNAIGAKIKLKLRNGEILVRQINPSKGFQSSTEYTQTFGLGDVDSVDSLFIFWPNNKETILTNIKIDQKLKLNVKSSDSDFKPIQKAVQPIFKTALFPIFNSHLEDKYEDFYQEKNIPILLSTEGPKAAVGDVNGDGKDDIYICGAKDQPGQLYLQTDNNFILKKVSDFEKTAFFEDTEAIFFDADGDKDLDLFVGTGGNEESPNSNKYLSRLYINDGKGNFVGNSQAIPYLGTNVSCARAFDYDGDGDLDLFVGSRSTPKVYGLTPPSFLLKNNGNAYFDPVDVPELQNLGMVRDALWVDIDKDSKSELVIVGDWFAPTIFKINNGTLQMVDVGLKEYSGFWSAVKVIDANKDGFPDLVLGNLGLNSPLKAQKEAPLKLFVADFEKNGTVDKVMTKSFEGRDVPIFQKREMVQQFPFMNKENLKHTEYAKRDVYGLFDQKVLKNAKVSEAQYLQSALAINDGHGKFKIQSFPYNVDLSCVNAICVSDVNKDGLDDILMGGNFYGYIPQFSRLDACRGIVLINQKQGNFNYVKNIFSGFTTSGQVRDIKRINLNGKDYWMSLSNNSKPEFFTNNPEFK